MSLSSKQWAAAGHTLWQAALGSGGFAAVFEAVAQPKIDVSGAEQGLILVGAAVAASAGSVVKSAVVNWLSARKQSNIAKAEATLAEALRKIHAADATPTPTGV